MTLSSRLRERAKQLDNAGDGLVYYSRIDARIDCEAAAALDEALERVRQTAEAAAYERAAKVAEECWLTLAIADTASAQEQINVCREEVASAIRALAREEENTGFLKAFRPKDAADEREAELARQRDIERRRAEMEMAHELANLICPEDIKEFGRRHGIPTLTEVIWNHGFMAGWRQRCRTPLKPG